MMGSLSFRICSALLLVAVADAFFFSNPMDTKGQGSYNGYSSPKYSIVKKTDDYELRQYEATNWVATATQGTTRSLFMRLFKYIGGDNESGSKISMTVPVAIKMEGAGSDKKFTMMFFLTSADNPKPKGADVVLTALPTFQAYVRTYSGYTNDEKLQENLEALTAAVGASSIDSSHYYSAGYDTPWKFWNRRNEVWVLPKASN